MPPWSGQEGVRTDPGLRRALALLPPAGSRGPGWTSGARPEVTLRAGPRATARGERLSTIEMVTETMGTKTNSGPCLL